MGGGRIWFYCSFLVTFLLLLCNTRATNTTDGKIKQVSDPTGNVNLSPFQQWESSYLCLKNTSTVCSDKYQLTEKGWVNVTSADGQDYCKEGGCGEHTNAVLLCLYLVKRDYQFMDKTHVPDLQMTIKSGCSTGFTGSVPVYSGASRSFETKSAILLSLLAPLLLMTYFGI